MQKPDFSKREILLCLFRSLFTTLFMVFAYLMVHLFDNKVWLVSVAATAFIVFAFPNAKSVKTRFLLGGYFCACFWGTALALISQLFDKTTVSTTIFCAIAVFLTTFSMTLFDFEHPPAAALATGIVLSSSPIIMSIASFVCVIILFLIKAPVANYILNKFEKKENSDE